jgi:hypothetical protein
VQTVAHWREHTAQTENRPKSWLLRDDLLFDIAKLQPDSIPALAKVRGINERIVNYYGKELCALIKEAQKNVAQALPVQVKKLNNKNQQHEAIIDGDWTELRIGSFQVDDVAKIRPVGSKNLLGNSEIEAGLKKEAYLFQDRTRVVMAQDKPLRNSCVYLFRMDNSAFETSKMRNANEGLAPSEFPIYIGTTQFSREERFEHHTNPDHSHYGNRSRFFSPRAYSLDFDECNLTEIFRPLLGEIDGLTYYEALAKEREVTELLRNKYGYWTYSA